MCPFQLDAHRAVPKDHMGGPSAVREPGAAWSPPTHAQPYVAQAPSVAADRLDHLRVKKMFVGGLAPDATEGRCLLSLAAGNGAPMCVISF